MKACIFHQNRHAGPCRELDTARGDARVHACATIARCTCTTGRHRDAGAMRPEAGMGTLDRQAHTLRRISTIARTTNAFTSSANASKSTMPTPSAPQHCPCHAAHTVARSGAERSHAGLIHTHSATLCPSSIGSIAMLPWQQLQQRCKRPKTNAPTAPKLELARRRRTDAAALPSMLEGTRGRRYRVYVLACIQERKSIAHSHTLCQVAQ